MNKILLSVAALMALNIHAAVQTLPFTDHFAYSDGNLFAVAAGVWDAAGNTGVEITCSNAAALTAPAGLVASSGKGVRWSPSGTARRAAVQFSTVSNTDQNTVYASFLINVLTPPSSGSKLIGFLENSTSSTTSPQLGIFVDSSSRIGIAKKGTSPVVLSGALGVGAHFVVVRYTFLASGNDQADLWVDPSSATFGAGSAPASLGSTTGSSDPIALSFFQINTPSGTGPLFYLDEVRISTNWADVTPSSGPPPAPPVTAPYFTQTLMSAEGIILRGNNGTSNGTFALLASANPNLPAVQWSSIATDFFDVNGNFNHTNPIDPNTPHQFFLLHIISSGSPPAIAPTITSQPQNQSAAIGQGAMFSVGATGTLALHYQWYFNTNTTLPDATNSTFTIASVSSNDVGVYFVIVTNIAGSATSSNAFLTIAEPPTNGDFFVSPSGNDSNPGTIDLPFATIPKAISVATAGNIIYVRGGAHAYSSTIRFTNSGTAGAMIELLAYPGEHPEIDFSTQPYGSSNRGFLFPTNGSYWHIKGLEIHNAGDNAIKVEGSHNVFDQLVLHHNGDTGLQIGFAHETSNDGSMGSSNLVLNCDSYLNYDSDNRGSDADGFACKLHPGAGNRFVGCRSWKNSDDGWDLFETDSSVVLSNCWSWHNGDATQYTVVGGSFQGNGNGIKLGGNGTGGSSVGVHYAYNCVAFNNNFPGRTRHGFDQNSHHGGNVLYNCAAWNNLYNFFFEDSAGGNPLIFRNCVSFSGAVSDFGSGAIEDHNTWLASNHAMIDPAIGTFSSADFNSIAESAAEAPRQPDGSLPTGFMRLVAGSNLIDKGVDVGIPFLGTAPDVAPYEYQP
jgi:hypothetical protein